jgi:hypothetical protein
VDVRCFFHCAPNDISLASFYPKHGPFNPCLDSFSFSAVGSDVAGRLLIHPNDVLQSGDDPSFRTDLSEKLVRASAPHTEPYQSQRDEERAAVLSAHNIRSNKLEIPILYLHSFCVTVQEFRGRIFHPYNKDVHVKGRSKALVEVDIDVDINDTTLGSGIFELVVIGLGGRSIMHGDKRLKEHCAILWLVQKLAFHYKRIGITAVYIDEWLKLESVEMKWIVVK